jgi:hypothetical protein
MEETNEIIYLLLYLSIVFIAIFLRNSYNQKNKKTKIDKLPDPYEVPFVIHRSIAYLYIWAKAGWWFDYLLTPQNMSLQTRVDQIILWTQNTKDIYLILWKNKIESFEDFNMVLQYIISSSTRKELTDNKAVYSMNFDMRQLNIVVSIIDGSILTITF